MKDKTFSLKKVANLFLHGTRKVITSNAEVLDAGLNMVRQKTFILHYWQFCANANEFESMTSRMLKRIFKNVVVEPQKVSSDLKTAIDNSSAIAYRKIAQLRSDSF